MKEASSVFLDPDYLATVRRVPLSFNGLPYLNESHDAEGSGGHAMAHDHQAILGGFLMVTECDAAPTAFGVADAVPSRLIWAKRG